MVISSVASLLNTGNALADPGVEGGLGGCKPPPWDTQRKAKNGQELCILSGVGILPVQCLLVNRENVF